jgi:hypothetical protein
MSVQILESSTTDGATHMADPKAPREDAPMVSPKDDEGGSMKWSWESLENEPHHATVI